MAQRNQLPGVILLSLIFFFTASALWGQPEANSLVNFAHLDRLYEEVMLDGQRMGIIHIYSDFPDYNWVDAPGEGAACIDDVARGAVLYLRHYHYTKNANSLERANNLLNFVLFMQAPNGLFYNFVHRDLTINKTRSNSQPHTDWWTWRALWAMSEALLYLPAEDSTGRDDLSAAIVRSFPAIDSLLQNFPETSGDQPTWLPSGTAADQAAVLQLALLAYYQYAPGQEVRSRIDKLARGIMKMQKGYKGIPPFGVFLSWRDTWHAWGNCQAYALLQAGSILGWLTYIDAGLREVRFFQPYLISKNQLSEFSVTLREGKQEITGEKQYPQIAYGIRPQVWAALAAFKITKDAVYARQAGEIAGWLFGHNTQGEMIYDPATGICFDGIDSDAKVNRNSGAESTLEALLTLVEIEQFPEVRKIVLEHYMKNCRQDK